MRCNRLQPVAISGKSDWRRSRENKPKPLPAVVTGCLRALMVRRGSTVRVRQRALQSASIGAFCFARTCTISSVRWVWSPLWSPQVQSANRPRLVLRSIDCACLRALGSAPCARCRSCPESPNRLVCTCFSLGRPLLAESQSRERGGPWAEGRELDSAQVIGHRERAALRRRVTSNLNRGVGALSA